MTVQKYKIEKYFKPTLKSGSVVILLNDPTMYNVPVPESTILAFVLYLKTKKNNFMMQNPDPENEANKTNAGPRVSFVFNRNLHGLKRFLSLSVSN